LILCIVYAPVKAYVSPVITHFETYATVDEYGLQIGDRFVEIDGSKVLLMNDVSVLLMLNEGDYHDLVVERNGQRITLNNFYLERHEVIQEDGTKAMLCGFSYGETVEFTFGSKLQYIGNTAVDLVRNVFWSLEMLFTGEAGFQDMTGPVGIIQLMSDTAEESDTTLDAILNVLYIGGFLAINLAVMNLLPIPALDGGRVVGLLLTVAIEGITRKKLDAKYEGYVHAVGMILLLALMAIILFKDIFAIFKR
jgi:regulator of sigma E protease